MVDNLIALLQAGHSGLSTKTKVPGNLMFLHKIVCHSYSVCPYLSLRYLLREFHEICKFIQDKLLII